MKYLRITLSQKKQQFETQRAKDLAKKKVKNPMCFWEDIKNMPNNQLGDVSLKDMVNHL